MKILNEFKTHHYMEEWTPENDWFCPHCGKKGHIWTENQGDYYAGHESMCTNCDHLFYLHGGPSPIKGADKKKSDQLKSGNTGTPTTPRGR